MAKENENEKTVKMLIEDNTALMLELGSLKRQLGGLKTSNANYRKQVENLKASVEHYKSLDIEGDKLYAKKITECENLYEQLDNEKRVVKALHEQIFSLQNQILGLKEEIKEKTVKIDNLSEAMEYEQKPWWKKLF